MAPVQRFALLASYPGSAIARHHDAERGHVEIDKYLLRSRNILAMVGEVVEPCVDVHMGGGVNKGTSAAIKLGVVALAREKLGDVLHIRRPIDFGILRA